MSKLSLDALKDKAESVASVDVLYAISGGLENSCHDGGSSSSSEEGFQSAQEMHAAFNALCWSLGY